MNSRRLFLLCLILIILTTTTVVYIYGEKINGELNQYRLGDAIIYPEMRNSYLANFWYKTYFRNTIAGKYMIKTNKCNDLKSLRKIIKNIKVENPPNKEDTLVIHLRAGDVVDYIYTNSIDDLLGGKYSSQYLYSYKTLNDELTKIEKNKIKNIIIVSGYHTFNNHKRSEEYIHKIKKYIESEGFKVSLRINKFTADEDFVWMCSSKNFLRSYGNYSSLINEMVKMNGGNILRETNLRETNNF